MSVTLVSPQSVPASNAAREPGKATGGEPAVPGLDFASLLLAQLAPGAALQSAPGEPAADTTIAANAADPVAAVAADPASADNAALLAALGIILPPAAGGAKPPDTPLPTPSRLDTRETPLAGALAARQTPSGPALGGEGEAELAAPAAPTARDDQPAKFAVAAAPIEALSTKSVALESTPSAANPPTPLALNSNSAVPERDLPLALPTPVRDQRWTSDFGQKIVWLATHDKQSAQLTLNPPQMGPIEVSLHLDKGNATASFVSANAEVRDAIETAMPRLREMFASAGIELGQTNVGAESFRPPGGDGEGSRSASRGPADNAILAPDPAAALAVRAAGAQQGNGMVDIFA